MWTHSTELSAEAGVHMEEKHLTPIKAVRAKCLDCCCDNANEVKYCPSEQCALWQYRMGHNPYKAKREWTGDQRAAQRERFMKNVHSIESVF